MAQAAPARRSRFLLVGLILAHLTAISHQVDGGSGASLLQRALLSVVTPLQRLVGGTAFLATELWRGWGFHRETYAENRALREQVRSLETELQLRAHRAQEAVRLRELLALQQAVPLDTLAAQVVGRDGVPWFRSLTLDKGEADGVKLDAAVISATGVVGRVFATGPHAARVQVLLDRDSGAAALVERSRVSGVVSGQVSTAEAGAEDLALKYVSERADVVVGDVVVTSGLDRIFPKGLVIGRVRSVGDVTGLFREIRVEPSARFDRLEEVLVLKGSPPALETPRSVE
ncbi:MAG TPA: rod shape-determining protein MreC [Vicinamibacteria bacterium]|jgi:rod shape-determining protein MreC